jgi:hypothetical protein
MASAIGSGMTTLYLSSLPASALAACRKAGAAPA